MKNLTIVGACLLLVATVLFYFTSSDFSLEEIKITHIMGVFAGVGIGLIIGGIVGYFSKGSAIKEEKRRKEFKKLQKEKVALEKQQTQAKNSDSGIVQ